MKKALPLIMAALVAASLAGCGSTSGTCGDDNGRGGGDDKGRGKG